MPKPYYENKTKEELETFLNESKTFDEFMKKLGYSGNRGNSINGVKAHLDKLGLDYSKFSSNNWCAHSHPKYDLNEILVENSAYSNHTKLKQRIIREGLLEWSCAICGINEWNGKPLVLQLDHINGNNRDNRIENLRFLCPNCHSQTDTFCRKN